MNGRSSAQNRIDEIWQDMSHSEREALLAGLREVMGHEADWEGLSDRAIAQFADYDSLPFDLGGHLLLAYDGKGLSVAAFKKWAGLFRGNK